MRRMAILRVVSGGGVFKFKIQRLILYLPFQTGCRQQSPLYLLRQHLLWLSGAKESPQVLTGWMENYCWYGQVSKSMGKRGRKR